MARESREVWAKRIDRLRESELTDAEFAAQLGVNLHTLRKWKWKLSSAKRSSRSGTETAQRRSRPMSGSSPTTTFVEMAAAPTAAVSPSIELRVGDVDVRVPVGFDEATLSSIISVLRRPA